jgi:septin 2
MKQLHNKVNIVPVIAKADVLTKKEVLRLKKKIMEEIEANGIKIYPLPDCDSDEDDDYKEQVQEWIFFTLKLKLKKKIMTCSQIYYEK